MFIPRRDGHDPTPSPDLPTCIEPHCTCEHVLTRSRQPAGHPVSLTVHTTAGLNDDVIVAKPVLDQESHQIQSEDDAPQWRKDRVVVFEDAVQNGVKTCLGRTAKPGQEDSPKSSCEASIQDDLKNKPKDDIQERSETDNHQLEKISN